MEEHPHRSRGREDRIGAILERGELGKGITFEIEIKNIYNKKERQKQTESIIHFV